MAAAPVPKTVLKPLRFRRDMTWAERERDTQRLGRFNFMQTLCRKQPTRLDVWKGLIAPEWLQHARAEVKELAKHMRGATSAVRQI